MINVQTQIELIELQTKIEYLEKMYDQTLNYVTNSIDGFWYLLFGVLGIIAIALYFLASSIITTGLDKGVNKLKAENKKITLELEQAKQANDKTVKELDEAVKEFKKVKDGMDVLLGIKD